MKQLGWIIKDGWNGWMVTYCLMASCWPPFGSWSWSEWFLIWAWRSIALFPQWSWLGKWRAEGEKELTRISNMAVMVKNVSIYSDGFNIFFGRLSSFKPSAAPGWRHCWRLELPCPTARPEQMSWLCRLTFWAFCLCTISALLVFPAIDHTWRPTQTSLIDKLRDYLPCLWLFWNPELGDLDFCRWCRDGSASEMPLDCAISLNKRTWSESHDMIHSIVETQSKKLPESFWESWKVDNWSISERSSMLLLVKIKLSKWGRFASKLLAMCLKDKPACIDWWCPVFWGSKTYWILLLLNKRHLILLNKGKTYQSGIQVFMPRKVFFQHHSGSNSLSKRLTSLSVKSIVSNWFSVAPRFSSMLILLPENDKSEGEDISQRQRDWGDLWSKTYLEDSARTL